MRKEKYFLRNFVFESYSNTIRCKPQNYWIASVRDGKLFFDSWDKAIINRYSKLHIRLLWKLNLIK